MAALFLINFTSLPGEAFDPVALAFTKPFRTVFKQKRNKKKKQVSSKKATHIITTVLPLLQDGLFVCITGSAIMTGGFDPAKPMLFRKKENGSGIIKLDLSNTPLPAEYKLAVFDAEKKTIIDYEPGPNRLLGAAHDDEFVTINCPAHFLRKYLWKGAGINIPVFSLRSENGWGSGDFTDIKLLADWASACGMKLIQLLPVNDTNATGSDKDSYPYSAISAFALDPKYINTAMMAHRLSVQISAVEQDTIERLNKLPYTDHSAVMKLKVSFLKKLFQKDRHDFRDDPNWFAFFDIHREWLVPYAVFCTLRDKYGTADHAQWNDHAFYNEAQVQEMAAPYSGDYEAVLFWYYVQYHLHLQLKDAADHAHKKGIILKADLPIGVGRHSVDTWMHPELFEMNMQAGAPPDAFSGTGQNWGFPTYNMVKMQEDHFSWFRKRMEQLEFYFDAVRIDHVLGFFRIWSIPMEFEKGTMGRFVPVVALQETDFTDAGITFDQKRFCNPFTRLNDDDVLLFKAEDGYHFRINMQQTSSFDQLPGNEKDALIVLYNKYFYESQDAGWETAGRKKLSLLSDCTDMLICAEDLGMVPAFTEELLQSLHILTLRVQQIPNESDAKFNDIAAGKYCSVVMPATHDMAPVRLWWEQHREDVQLFFNEILRERGSAAYFCEPWICEKIINMHLASPAMWSIFLLQDILAMNGNTRRPVPAEERINDPADNNHVWKYRMHMPLEKLLADEVFNSSVKSRVKGTGR